MISLDNANRTNNYSVFRSLLAPELQALTDEEQMASMFANLRKNRVDLGKALMLAPTWLLPPQINDKQMLRLRGGFEFRPMAIRFDLLFSQHIDGWRIAAISVAELDSTSTK